MTGALRTLSARAEEPKQRALLGNQAQYGFGLSGSHRSTHIASDLASRALASQAKPQRESESQAFRIARSYWERGSGGVQSTGVSQRVRVTGRDESQSVPSPEKLFKTRDLELPFFEGSLPSCSPHSAGYTRTFVHPYFPVSNLKKHADFPRRRPTSQDFRSEFFWRFHVSSDQANVFSHC